MIGEGRGVLDSTYDERKARRAAAAPLLREAAERLRAAPEDGTGVNAAMATVFESWGRMARLEPEILARVGGAETVELARRVIDAYPVNSPSREDEG